MPPQDLIIVKKGFEFCKWLMNHTGKFPKSHRFSIAVKMENAMLEFVELVTVAGRRQNRLPLLFQADERLIKVRMLFRMSYEMQFINVKSYEFGSRQLVELGKLTGGWIKNPGKN